MAEAADEDANKTFYDPSSPAFKEALRQMPEHLVDLIYEQLKIEPHRLVELAETESGESERSEDGAEVGASDSGVEDDMSMEEVSAADSDED